MIQKCGQSEYWQNKLIKSIKYTDNTNNNTFLAMTTLKREQACVDWMTDLANSAADDPFNTCKTEIHIQTKQWHTSKFVVVNLK